MSTRREEQEDQAAAFAAQARAHAERGVEAVAVWSGEGVMWLTDSRPAVGEYLFVIARAEVGGGKTDAHE